MSEGPTEAQRNCRHEVFGVSADVYRMSDTGHVTCDITVACRQCGLPFSWVGPMIGVSFSGPAVSVDGLELRIPIEPGPRPIPVSGVARYEMPAKPRES